MELRWKFGKASEGVVIFGHFEKDSQELLTRFQILTGGLCRNRK
jgi:hypothetical protein